MSLRKAVPDSASPALSWPKAAAVVSDRADVSDSIKAELGRGDSSVGDSRPPLPSWLQKLPPDMQEFVAEESKHGWPYLRLARGLKMQDLSKEELMVIVETWMDAKRRHEQEFGE